MWCDRNRKWKNQKDIHNKAEGRTQAFQTVARCMRGTTQICPRNRSLFIFFFIFLSSSLFISLLCSIFDLFSHFLFHPFSSLVSPLSSSLVSPLSSSLVSPLSLFLSLLSPFLSLCSTRHIQNVAVKTFKRLRVFWHHMCAWCRYTRGRFEWTHEEPGGHRQFCLPKFAQVGLQRASEVHHFEFLTTLTFRALRGNHIVTVTLAVYPRLLLSTFTFRALHGHLATLRES